jgi:hypothetical protein
MPPIPLDHEVVADEQAILTDRGQCDKCHPEGPLPF